MKDLFDLFNEEDYSRARWGEDDILVPADDVMDYDIDDLTEIEIPDLEDEDDQPI